MKQSRLLTIGALLSSFAWVLAGGCSAGDASPPATAGGGSGGTLGDASSDTTVVSPDASGTQGGAGNGLHPLCGEGQCVPDDAQSCRRYEPPAEAGGAPATGDDGQGGGGEGGRGEGGDSGAGTGQGGQLASGGEASQGGAPEGGAGGEGGASRAGAGSGGGAAAAAGAGGDRGVPGAPASYGCQVARGNQRQCQVAGSGDENAPCFSGADCQPGLACVTQGEAGRCLRYCCGGDATCGAGTYCAEQALRSPSTEAANAEPVLVPACVPADDCSLEDTFPCPAGADCRCKGNTACMVVRSDGTTTCTLPGAGKQGEACPCAWNHVCSSVTQTCVKICRLDRAAEACGSQKCQASSELPPNFGVCVGPLK